nr:putative ribonuclease h protein [Quercus suber]
MAEEDRDEYLEKKQGIYFAKSFASLYQQGIATYLNKAVFRDNNPPKLNRDEVTAKAAEFAFLGVNGKHARMRTTIQVRWNPPPTHWFKLSSDGSSMGNLGRAGGGGIIRNAEGEWIKGYARAIGSTASVATELRALRDGVQLCLELKLPAVIIELKAMFVVDLIRNTRQNPSGINNIVADCRQGMRKIPRVHIQHCYREANKSNVALLLSLDAAGTMYEGSIANVSGS